MRTSLQVIAVVLVLAGCSTARHQTVAGSSVPASVAIPLPSLAPSAQQAVRPLTLPLAGVRAHHISAPRSVSLARALVGEQTALTLAASSGPRRDAPEMRVTLALQYSF